MPNPKKMTRSEMQTQALVIESLLDTAQAMFGCDGDFSDAITMVEMASTRATELNRALDSVNAPEVGV